MPDSPDVPGARHRNQVRRPRWSWRTLAHTAGLIALGAAVLCLGAITVVAIIDSSEPVVWGTFTAEGCTTGYRDSCRIVGTWVSDDGTVLKPDVALDGRTGSDGIVRASYRPTGITNDEENNVVHVELTSGVAQVLVPGFCFVGLGTYLFLYAVRHGFITVARRRRLR